MRHAKGRRSTVSPPGRYGSDAPSRDGGETAVPAPTGLRASRVELAGETYVVFSYPKSQWDLPDALTAAERQIALAVVGGASNETIASSRASSARTVAHQVVHLREAGRLVARGARVEARIVDPTMAVMRAGGRAHRDELAVVEAAYALGANEADWVAGLAEAAAAVLDEGWGMTATTWTGTSAGIALRTMSTIGGPSGLPDAALEAMQMSREIQSGLVRSAPCTSLALAGGARLVDDDRGSRGLVRLGIRDAFTVLAIDAAGFVTGISAYRAEATRPPRRTVALWSRIACHLSAGFRVHRSLSAAHAESANHFDPLRGSEAILKPGGKLAHAERAAQKAQLALARAVVAIDRARTRAERRDPDAALEAWRGLVQGRWSLVEHFDSDGQRFLVARKNDPDARGPRGLNARERQVLASRSRGLSLKLIAYELGLSIPSVSRALRSGMTKLGISSHEELVSLFLSAGPSR
jgi:DNA-binding CsgD family transcriptional regulator